MHDDSRAKNIRQLLTSNQKVKSLSSQALKTRDLRRAVCGLLPSMLADYCQVRSFENGTLTLNAATGAAATQLRFVVQQLLPKLKNLPAFNGLEKIVVRVQASENKEPRVRRRIIPPVSQHNCELIRDAAHSLEDTELAKSLLRLADTLAKQREQQ